MVTASCKFEGLTEIAGEKGTAPIDKFDSEGKAEIKCLFTQSIKLELDRKFTFNCKDSKFRLGSPLFAISRKIPTLALRKL